jgi:hypothetical protein
MSHDVTKIKRRTMIQEDLRLRDLFEHLRAKHNLPQTHHGFDRTRLRGLSGATDEFHLAAIAQNLKKMALRLMRLPVQATTCAAM